MASVNSWSSNSACTVVSDYNDYNTRQHDERHYANMHESDEPDHYNYLEFNQLMSDDDTVEQRQRLPGTYEQLDPSVLATLRRPPAPSVP